MKLCGQQEFRHDNGVSSHDKKSIRGCVSNLERNGTVGNRAFLDGLQYQLKICVVFGRISY